MFHLLLGLPVWTDGGRKRGITGRGRLGILAVLGVVLVVFLVVPVVALVVVKVVCVASDVLVVFVVIVDQAAASVALLCAVVIVVDGVVVRETGIYMFRVMSDTKRGEERVRGQGCHEG